MRWLEQRKRANQPLPTERKNWNPKERGPRPALYPQPAPADCMALRYGRYCAALFTSVPYALDMNPRPTETTPPAAGTAGT